MEALADEKAGAPDAAGALWALSTISHAWLAAHGQQEAQVADRSSREQARQALLKLAEHHEAVRPTDAPEALRDAGVVVDRAVVSRTIGDLLEDGVLEPAAPPAGSDRRNRWYRLRGEAHAT